VRWKAIAQSSCRSERL